MHAALIVGSPSFVKASVLCRLPNQRERLKHSFVGAKPADVPTASPRSFFYFFYFIFFTFFNAALLHTYIHGAPEGMRHWYSQYFKSHKREMNEDTEKRGR